MRISDWSSDVCSSDLLRLVPQQPFAELASQAAIAGLFGEIAHAAATLADISDDRHQQQDEHCHVTAGKQAGRVPDGEGIDVWLPLGQRWRSSGQPRFANTAPIGAPDGWQARSEEHTSELQSLMRTSYAVFCLKKKKT